MPSSKRRTFGFTLVELLVVIAIIAILMGILLPALSAARRQANTVKCASQLREIGNALQLYASEFRDFYPIVQHDATPTTPVSDPSMRSPIARNDYWYNFLLKYFTKRAYSNTAGRRLVDFQNTPLWGCPAVDKQDFDASTSSAEFNSGYGMAPYALYDKNRFLGANAGPALAQGYTVRGKHWAMCNSTNEGQYFRKSQWTKASDHGIITDSRSWFVETRSVANEAAIVPPNPPKAAIGYDANATDQFDRWRHSRPKMNKIMWNMLYVDGHVGTIGSVVEGYTAIRMHFPQ